MMFSKFGNRLSSENGGQNVMLENFENLYFCSMLVSSAP
jgi:hypothetical protein